MAELNSDFPFEIEKQYWLNFPLISWYLVDIQNNEGELVENEKYGTFGQ